MCYFYCGFLTYSGCGYLAEGRTSCEIFCNSHFVLFIPCSLINALFSFKLVHGFDSV